MLLVPGRQSSYAEFWCHVARDIGLAVFSYACVCVYVCLVWRIQHGPWGNIRLEWSQKSKVEAAACGPTRKADMLGRATYKRCATWRHALSHTRQSARSRLLLECLEHRLGCCGGQPSPVVCTRQPTLGEHSGSALTPYIIYCMHTMPCHALHETR